MEPGVGEPIPELETAFIEAETAEENQILNRTADDINDGSLVGNEQAHILSPSFGSEDQKEADASEPLEGTPEASAQTSQSDAGPTSDNETPATKEEALFLLPSYPYVQRKDWSVYLLQK